MTATRSSAPMPAGKEESQLFEYIDVLVARRYVILAFVIVFILIGAIYAMLATRVYQADMLVQVEPPSTTSGSPQDVNVVSQVSNLFNSPSPTAAELEILGSRSVLGHAVDKLQMYTSVQPKRFPIIGNWFVRHSSGLSTPGFFGMGDYTWGNESLKLGQFDVPETLYGSMFHIVVLENNQMQLTGKALSQPVTLTLGQVTTIPTADGPVTIKVDSVHANPHAGFELSRSSRLQTIESVRRTVTVLEQQKPSGVILVSYPDTNPERAAAFLQEVGKAYLAQNIDRRTQDAQKSLAFLEDQLPGARRNLEQAEENYRQMRQQRGTVDLSNEGRLYLQQGIDIQQNLLQLRQRRAEAATRFSDTNPTIRALDDQIAIAQSKLGSLEGQLRTLPTTEQDAVRLQREVSVDTTLYTNLLTSAQQLRLAEAGQVGTVRIIDQAAVPERPIKPKTGTILVIAAVFGLLVGVAWAFGYDVLFTGVTEASELEERTGVPVIATVPESVAQVRLHQRMLRRQKGQFVLAEANPDDLAVESLRSLRIALQLAVAEARNNVVMLTGATPGVGKSFVTVNLAQLLAAAGKRVLVIDADLRKGYLDRYMSKPRTPGLAEYLAGSASIETVLHANVLPSVDFIACGQYPKTPSEMLSHSRLVELLDRLRPNYDMILCDTTPVLPVVDAEVIAALAGTILLVARAAQTRIGEVTESVKRLTAGGHTVNGVVFNSANPHSSKIGSKYGAYRYAAYKYDSNDAR